MTTDHAPTPSQTVGPYFSIGLTEKNSAGCIAGPQAKGERIWLTCRVLDGDGVPVNDALIEIWQADSDGKYHHPDDPQSKTSDSSCRGFGRMGTGEDGRCEFETVKPGRVPGPANTTQAPHLNIAVYARGILLHLYTRIYFSGDAANDEDPILALVTAERRETLMAKPEAVRQDRWSFDIHLSGENETVFFDV